MQLYKLGILILLTFILIGCGGTEGTQDSDAQEESSSDTSTGSSQTLSSYLIDYSNYTIKSENSSLDVSSFILENKTSHEEDGDYEYTASNIIDISLNDANVTIDTAGVYRLSGTISDGQVLVDAGDEDIVKLILNGVDITSSTSAPIFIKNVDKAIVILETNSVNTLRDTSLNEEKGTLLSKSDLSVTGDGELNIYSNSNDALRSNDGLVIKNAIINITSVDDGIRGKDYLIIESGNFNITADGDGLKSDNEDELDRGYIYISGGDFTINALNDAIQAQTDLLIDGGVFKLTTANGSSAIIDDETSAKGLKSDGYIVIDAGVFTIDSADDALHCDGSIIVNFGTFTISTGDDGIHADTSLEVNGGKINISKSYEGLESGTITINNGYIDITASDDGINVAGDDRNSNYHLYINNGFIVVDSAGDGLDANGYITMNNGIVIVNGPTSSGDGALDSDRTFSMNGGALIAVGSSRMASAPSSSSAQNAISITFNSRQSAGELVNIQNSSGETIVTFASTKAYESFIFSSADLVSGSYSIYTGGSDSGESYHGVYNNGTYSSGSAYQSFTISSRITNIR